MKFRRKLEEIFFPHFTLLFLNTYKIVYLSFTRFDLLFTIHGIYTYSSLRFTATAS